MPTQVGERRIASPAVDRLQMDGNSSWQSSDDAIAHLERLSLPMFAIEEPLAAASEASEASDYEDVDLLVWQG